MFRVATADLGAWLDGKFHVLQILLMPWQFTFCLWHGSVGFHAFCFRLCDLGPGDFLESSCLIGLLHVNAGTFGHCFRPQGLWAK